ncbi:MAG TPA: hypothetical protein VM142_02630 [Acidimicrobiales bacterium]|nr:hypothetical protein [Acidimicrobiales bacterium]
MTDDPPIAAQFDPEAILNTLCRHGVDFIVIGGVAANLHGSSQLTADLDVLRERSDRNLARLVEALKELQAVRVTDPDHPAPPSAESFAHRIERFVSPAGNIDIFAEVRRIGRYEDIFDSSEQVEITPGVRVNIAAIDDVIMSKAGSGREKDPNHIRSLERVRDEQARLREEARDGD